MQRNAIKTEKNWYIHIDIMSCIRANHVNQEDIIIIATEYRIQNECEEMRENAQPIERCIN